MTDFFPGQSPEASWKHLHENGLQRATNVETNDLIEQKPSWLDEQRFKQAKKVMKLFRIGVNFSSLTGLLGILQVPGALEPLLSTGKSKDIPSLNKRYVDTLVHVESWYDDDIFDPSTKGYKSIRLVRAMHKRVQYNMNNNFNVTMEGKPRIWYNDFDCAMTQFAFIGMAMLYPKKCGLIAATIEDLEGINYYWRVLGYLMGMEDEFNLCQFDDYEDIRSFFQLIYEKESSPRFKNGGDSKGLQMAQAICLALEYYLPMTSFNNLVHWWRDSVDMLGHEVEPMTLHQRIIHYTTMLSFNHLLSNRAILAITTKIYRSQLRMRIKNQDKIYEKLKKNYEGDSRWIFYSDRVDYFAEKPSKANQVVSNCSKSLEKLDITQKHTEEQQVVCDQRISSEICLNGLDDINKKDLGQVLSKPSGCPFEFGSGQ